MNKVSVSTQFHRFISLAIGKNAKCCAGQKDLSYDNFNMTSTIAPFIY